MLRRVLSVSIALLGTVVAVVIYWVAFMPWFHFPIRNEYWIRLVVALAEMAIAIYLVARWRSWPALLLLAGSIPMILVNVDFVGWRWRMDRYYSTSPPVDDPRLAFLFPSDNEYSPVNAILHNLIYFSMVCLPLAFFWYFFRFIDQHLTKR